MKAYQDHDPSSTRARPTRSVPLRTLEPPPDLQALVATLRRYHSAYKRLNNKRDRTPMSDRPRVWPTLQRQADTLCGKIMRTERRIIEELLKQKPASEL